MSQHEEPGLRERKRLATRWAIQHAVLTLSAERGMDQVAASFAPVYNMTRGSD